MMLVALIGAAAQAGPGVFAFKDLEGFEACLRTDHLVETVKTDQGSQTRFLTQGEIRARCVDAAVSLASGSKSDVMTKALLDAARRLSSDENALGLVSILVDRSLPSCNDLAAYEVMIKALSRPRDSDAFYARSRAIVKRCLKDGAFREDFADELDSSNTYLSAAACDILLEEKLVKSCKENKR